MMLDEAKNLVEICLLLLLLAHWGQIVFFFTVVVIFNKGDIHAIAGF
jgi:hypothetical protein